MHDYESEIQREKRQSNMNRKSQLALEREPLSPHECLLSTTCKRTPGD